MNIGKSTNNIIETSITVTRESTLWSNVYDIVNDKIDYDLKRNIVLMVLDPILNIIPIATDEIR